MLNLFSLTWFLVCLISYVLGSGFENLCGQFTEIDKTEINLPIENGHRWVPWELYPNAKAYKGEGFTKGWNYIQKIKVGGLNQTVDDVFKYFADNQCHIFIHGGAIRDLVLGIIPNDIDGIVTCEMNRLKELCESRYGREQCINEYPGEQFGHDQIRKLALRANTELATTGLDIVHWNLTYGQNATSLEYTINSLSLYKDPIHEKLIDLVNALPDLCGRKIRIAARVEEWGIWINQANKQNLRVLYRFIKAEAMGFLAADRQNFDFLIQTFMKTFDDHRLDFKKFFCHHYLNGRFIYQRDFCVYQPLTSEIRKKMQRYIDQLRLDFDLKFFRLKLERAILEMYDYRL